MHPILETFSFDWSFSNVPVAKVLEANLILMFQTLIGCCWHAWGCGMIAPQLQKAKKYNCQRVFVEWRSAGVVSEFVKISGTTSTDAKKITGVSCISRWGCCVLCLCLVFVHHKKYQNRNKDNFISWLWNRISGLKSKTGQLCPRSRRELRNLRPSAFGGSSSVKATRWYFPSCSI